MRLSAFQIGQVLVVRIILPPVDTEVARELMSLARTGLAKGVRLLVVDVASELTPCAVATLAGIARWVKPEVGLRVCGGLGGGRAALTEHGVSVYEDWMAASRL